MRVALVHDYLREYGGAERVVEVMHEIWPQAPLFTSFVDWEALGKHAYRFADWDIRSSWVQHNPIVKKLHSPLRFLAPRIWESFDLSSYDVVISSSGWFICRGVAMRSAEVGTGPDALVSHPTSSPLGSLGSLRPSSVHTRTIHQYDRVSGSRLSDSGRSMGSLSRATRAVPINICYIHHPPRNLYGYATGSALQKYPLVRAYATVINFFMRHYDYETAQKVDYFVANSKETARRVWKFYRRESTVIYPPVTTELRTQNSMIRKNRAYYLSVGRLAWAKRVDLAIVAANKLKFPLKVVGTGPEEQYLRSIAGPSIEFVGAVSDAELAKLYAGAKALIFTALDEDFGMVPVEAMAAGVPVIALGQGGVLETVIDPSTGSGQATGVLFKKPEVTDLIDAIERFNSLRRNWADDCRTRAAKFSKERFKKELKDFVNEKYRQKASSST